LPAPRVHPRPEDYDAAYCDYQAEHGLSNTAMCETLRQYGHLSEVHERAQASRKMRDGKRNEAGEAMLAEALAEFEATCGSRAAPPFTDLYVSMATSFARIKCVLALVEATHVADARMVAGCEALGAMSNSAILSDPKSF
jgi:hypothetical protein